MRNFALIASLLAFTVISPALATEPTAPATEAAPAAETAPATETMSTLKFGKPYAFATSESQKNGAVFLSMTNNLGHGDKLLSVSSDVAEKVEIHVVEMVDGVMKMRAVEGGFDLPIGGTLTLDPSGSHIMLLGLKAPLTAGSTFNIQLTFEKTPVLTLPVEVIAPGTTPEAAPKAE